MDAVKDTINAQLAQLRSKLDNSPTAQRLEVRIFSCWLRIIVMRTLHLGLRNLYYNMMIYHAYDTYIMTVLRIIKYSHIFISLLLKINNNNIYTVGSNKCTKRNTLNWCNSRYGPNSFPRNECGHNLKHRRVPIPRIKIIRGTRKTQRRRHAMVNLLGSLQFLFNYWSICWFSIILDPILLCIQDCIPIMGNVTPNTWCQVLIW